MDEALEEAGRLHLAVEHVGQVGADRTREGGHGLHPLLPTHPAATARGLLHKHHTLSRLVRNKLLYYNFYFIALNQIMFFRIKIQLVTSYFHFRKNSTRYLYFCPSSCCPRQFMEICLNQFCPSVHTANENKIKRQL